MAASHRTGRALGADGGRGPGPEPPDVAGSAATLSCGRPVPPGQRARAHGHPTRDARLSDHGGRLTHRHHDRLRRLTLTGSSARNGRRGRRTGDRGCRRTATGGTGRRVRRTRVRRRPAVNGGRNLGPDDRATARGGSDDGLQRSHDRAEHGVDDRLQRTNHRAHDRTDHRVQRSHDRADDGVQRSHDRAHDQASRPDRRPGQAEPRSGQRPGQTEPRSDRSPAATAPR